MQLEIMEKQDAARTHKTEYKKFLLKQIKIVKMLKREPFKYARQLFPIKDLQESVDKLGFDKNVRKIKIINLITHFPQIKNNYKHFLMTRF